MKKINNSPKYIFLSYGIGGVGGGQNYLKNRCELYKKQGFKVYLAYTLYDPTYDDFLFDAVIRIQAIGHPLNMFGVRFIRNVVKKLQSLISFQEGDNIIIESNNIYMAFWGELLAEACKGKHFYYILGENDVISDLFEDQFLKFKLDRKEIAGIHQDSVRRLFADFRYIENSEIYRVSAASHTCMRDYNVPNLEDLPTCDYTIGLLSRLDKPFVMPTLIDLIDFFVAHVNKTTNLIIVGDGSESIIQDIKHLYQHINNVNLIFTGALDPLPTRYPQICDVCIGTSGCARMTHMYGRITITIDGADFKPIGILGHTTENRLFRADEPIVSIKELLDQILIDRVYPTAHSPIPEHSSRDEVHNIHHNYIISSSSVKEYFNVLSKINRNCTLAEIIYLFKRLVESLIGTSFYYKLFGRS